MAKLISGDAPVASDGGTGSAAGPSRRKASVPREPLPSPAKFHNVSDGAYTTNRRGIRLCDDFQQGHCEGVDLNARCRRNSQKVHQCSKCLGADHCAKDCDRIPKPPSKGKGGGKSKASRKGKPSRRPQY